MCMQDICMNDLVLSGLVRSGMVFVWKMGNMKISVLIITPYKFLFTAKQTGAHPGLFRNFLIIIPYSCDNSLSRYPKADRSP